MNTSIPETRSKQLHPLSVEHRDGMDFVVRIRTNVCKISPERLRAYTCWYWQNHIRPHFYQEERILLPKLPKDHPLAKQLEEEHFYIRELILSLDKQADVATFQNLCDFLERHIRFEETKLFPYLEKSLSQSELDLIANKIEQHPVECPAWNDIFWT